MLVAIAASASQGRAAVSSSICGSFQIAKATEASNAENEATAAVGDGVTPSPRAGQGGSVWFPAATPVSSVQ